MRSGPKKARAKAQPGYTVWLQGYTSRLAGRRLFESPQGGSPLPGILQGALDVPRRGAARDVMQRQHLGKSEARVEACVKARVDRLQIGERKFLQIASALPRQSNRFADRFVGEARRHSTFDKICRRGPRIHKARTCGLIHLGVIEFDGVHK